MNVQRNVSWSLSPADGCDDSVKLLLMISSGPRNAQQRQACRDRVKVGHLDIVKIIQMGGQSCPAVRQTDFFNGEDFLISEKS